MFEKYLISEKTFHNVESTGEIIGYNVGLRIPYYRGITLSCVNEINLTINGVSISHDDMTVMVETGSFPYRELSTVINNRWEMTEEAVIFVNAPGGLEAKEHIIEAFVSLRISYQPHPNTGADKKIVKLGTTRKVDKEVIQNDRNY
ncbi:DUF6379 domain-containing protein [Bacillus sp. B1-b2]|uniref:C-glycoside deglycosidase beta subunit domain-containing protein n=1 Tax=Bacillus sp. B1-b2 TaxID=2653201 RepID=UPI0012617BB2|nr:DUF6379 domain-containing protein [Bacillus sp. B1-b2]KAB7672106.1 hypothetical protein F9279_04115 [Bacillus sp. B1-b2]